MSDTIPATCAPAWAHAAGLIDLQPVSAVPADLQEVADRIMIQETVSRYAIAYDERRLDVLASLYTESGSYYYQVGDGPRDGRTGRDRLIPWLGEIMESQTDQRRHMMSSLVIDRIEDGEASVIAYKTIYSVEASAELVTTGLYRFYLVKLDNRWLIQEALDALDRPF